MLSGNNLFKQNKIGNVVRITTDDIPEGELNKYNLDYPDGKYLGDIVIRYTSEEIPCHKRLNGQTIYRYDNLDFYSFCALNKQKAEEGDEDYSFYNKTEEEYTDFYNNHTWQDSSENYCPYFVLGTTEITVYEVAKNNTLGYTFTPDLDTLANNFVFADKELTTIIDSGVDWAYTGDSSIVSVDTIHLPTIPNISTGNEKTFYFVVTGSRVQDNSTSIRNILIGSIEKLSSEDEPYVRNVGTIQNLVLDFGIPSGKTPTIEVGEVSTGDVADITTTETVTGVKLNFVLPKGDKGDAGGVLNLNYIGNKYPTSPNTNDIFYNTYTNIIYIYKDDNWTYFDDADKGMIYLYNNVVYAFDGASLNKTYATVQLDNKTIALSSGNLEVIGQKTKTGVIVYDWIGTLAEWELGRANKTIPDNYICFVTDD